jgi:malate dehydrogenase (oxaloacetate-decarboxylating)(NADP+)
VITNGTAVLGLGNIGPLAGKPVMEGKGVLFKKFAGIDVFDIEIAENDPDKLVDIIASLEPTFGGINLEDIKAPECFYVERKLRERMKIPVFHDDQHGTAIIVGAAILNGLRWSARHRQDGQAGLPPAPVPPRSPASTCWCSSACGPRTSAVDRKGVIYTGPWRRWIRQGALRASETDARTPGRRHRRRRRLPRPVRPAAC